MRPATGAWELGITGICFLGGGARVVVGWGFGMVRSWRVRFGGAGLRFEIMRFKASCMLRWPLFLGRLAKSKDPV